MDLYSIASGSSGNCIYVGDKQEGILVDTGISMKRIREGLEAVGMSFENTKGIFITHEHSDHIASLGPILRKYDIPVYGTEGTLDYIRQSGKMKNVDMDLFQTVLPDNPVDLLGMEITPFSISHDAADPVSYTFEKAGKKVAVATDMGKYSDYTLDHLNHCDGMLIESNHDINMLQVGAYPYSLKMRILGDRGHLSNDTSARLIIQLMHDKLKNVLLGHLSEENNLPELAYRTVAYEISRSENVATDDLPLKLAVAKRHEPTAMLTI